MKKKAGGFEEKFHTHTQLALVHAQHSTKIADPAKGGVFYDPRYSHTARGNAVSTNLDGRHPLISPKETTTPWITNHAGRNGGCGPNIDTIKSASVVLSTVLYRCERAPYGLYHVHSGRAVQLFSMQFGYSIYNTLPQYPSSPECFVRPML